jgi:hypothetical protein
MLSLVWMITTPTYSSAQVVALSVTSRLIEPRTVLSTALACYFVNVWTICIVSGFRLVEDRLSRLMVCFRVGRWLFGVGEDNGEGTPLESEGGSK